MVRGQDTDYSKWRNHCGLLAVVLLGASVGPLIYCMGWAMAPEAVSFGYCVRTHPLEFPATIFVAGGVTGVAAFILHHLHGESQRLTERQDRDLDRRVEEAKKRNSVRTPRLADGLNAGSGEVPDEIDVGDEVRFEGDDGDGDDPKRADSDTVMAFMERQQQRQHISGAAGRTDNADRRRRDYYVPPGMDEAPELYVDATTELRSVDDKSRRVNNPNLPYADIDDALRHAFKLVMDDKTAVVVRVIPGVYQTSLEVPGRVAVVNHRMPVDASVDDRLEWIRGQDEIDDPERVTFLPPKDADFAVRTVPGEKQGLFGCYFAGRQGVAQVGLKCRDNAAVVVVNCGFESFRGGGAEVVNSGEELPGRKVQFVGCLWRANSAPDRGGALRIRGGVVRVEASIFENNRAPSGGAVSVIDTEKPTVFERSLLQRNRALGPDDEPVIDDLKLSRMVDIEGVGGAMRVRNGLVKVLDTIFDGNDAAIGGGAIGAVEARVVVKSTGDGRGVCRENRAGAGGAVFAVGGIDTPAMIRFHHVEVVKNLGTALGGGAACVGNGVVQAKQAYFESNRANGGAGGAIAAWRGGSIRIRGGEFLSNTSSNAGGAVAAINGSLSLTDHAVVRDNTARGGAGGGIVVVTTPDPKLDYLVGQSGFSLPFEVQIEDCRIESNQAAEAGGGLRAGNLMDDKTFPLVLAVMDPELIDGNQARDKRAHCQNVWVEWAGDLKANDEFRASIKSTLE